MELITKRFSISVGAADTLVQTVTLSGVDKPGLIQELKIIIPNTDNNVTHTFTIVDPDAFARYTIAALAENTSHILQPNRVIGNGYKFGMLPSGAPGNAITITLVVSYWA